MDSPAPPPTVIRFGLFELDAANGELRKAGVSLKIHPQPLQVLLLLTERPGQVVAREEIRRCLWGDNTYVDFERGINFCISQIRAALGDDADKPRYIETIPRRGYRFIASVSSKLSVESAPAHASIEVSSLPRRDADESGSSVLHLPESRIVPRQPKVTQRLQWAYVGALSLAGLVGLALGLGASGRLFFSRRARALTDKDTIVLADFTNTTGDEVFDDTLRQGLSVQLEQSLFLRTISDQQIQQTLQLMGQKPGAKLAPGIARELCQRTGSAAVLEGSIAQIGSQYLLTLKAVSCSSGEPGESLASTEAQASDKNHVLDALGKTASEIRNKLGESLSTVQKFDTPLEQATTTSLEALQAYSLGHQIMFEKGDFAGAIPLFQQAIRLDPQFALAYDFLGVIYSQNGETRLAAQNMRKAYELRDRVSQKERLRIESSYSFYFIADLPKARQAYELWAQTFPRDCSPHMNLGVIYTIFGEYDSGLSEIREAWRLDPGSLNNVDLVSSYLSLNRIEEARATADIAQAKRLDSPFLHYLLYMVASLQNDTAGMEKEVAWSTSRPGLEDALLARQADAAAYFGQLVKARLFSRLAKDSAKGFGNKESPAGYEVEGALREGLFHNAAQALQHAKAALGLSNGRDVQYGAALARSFAGDDATAQALAYDLNKRFPEDTVVQFNYLPVLRAQFALNRKDPLKAIEALRATAPYELGSPGTINFSPALYPVYVRGEAYLAAHQGAEAATEFRKILDHRGVVWTSPIGALAHLQLGRAYALQGDSAKATSAYQDFLTLWKNADADIPILIAAKAEYAKLK